MKKDSQERTVQQVGKVWFRIKFMIYYTHTRVLTYM